MIKLNHKYQPLFTNDTRYFCITGGRGSAKSFSVTTFLLMLTYEVGHVILFTRYTLTSAHISIIPEFVEKIELTGTHEHFEVTKDEIVNKLTGSRILFKGIKTSSGTQTANLKSLSGVTTWVLDEAEELTDENTFDKIDFSIRAKDKQNRVILLLNPTTKEHFIYKRFFEGQGVQPSSNKRKGDTTYIHTSYIDNYENLSKSFIQQAENLKTQNPPKYEHTILGGWLNRAEGIIFDNWVVGEYNPNDYVYFGQDYGFAIDPTTLIECAIYKSEKKIYVKQHVYRPGMTTSEIEAINKVAGNRLIIADNAEPRLIAELRARGQNIKGIDKPKVIERVRLLQDWQIIVDQDSSDIVKELNNYTWSDKKSETPIDAYNHALDAIGYVLWHVIGKPTSGQYSFSRHIKP